MRRVVDALIAFLIHVLCRIETDGVPRLPDRGPLILVTNHINFLEVPLLYTIFRPRRIIGLAKSETWDNPVLRRLADLWEAIPIKRGLTDTTAFRRACEELARGSIVGVAPEGTRSGHGRLRRGSAGVVLLAAKSGAPIIPVAHHGGERFWKNLRSLRRTRVSVRVGKPFTLVEQGRRISREERVELADRVMLRIARLLPARYRGVYSDHVESAAGSNAPDAEGAGPDRQSRI